MLKAIFLILLTTSLWAADDHATVSLQRFQNKIIVTVDHDAGWHTYWKNPGDSGLASIFKFFQNKKPIVLKAYEWPVPTKHIETGDILTIGYSGRQHFFFDDMAGEVDAHISVLICKDICIPGEADLKLKAGEEFNSNRTAKPYSGEELKASFENRPQDQNLAKGFEYYLTRKKDSNVLTLHYTLKDLNTAKLPHELNFLTGFPHAPFGYKREKLYFKDGTLYGQTDIEWDGEYQDPPVALAANGTFPRAYDLRFLYNAPTNGRVSVVTLKIKNFSNSSPALDDFYKQLPPHTDKLAAVGSVQAGSSLLEYLFFAFIGGLILNLMPCVLPVISLKLFGLIKHKNTPRKKLLSHNLAYTAGVISTFMVLASVIVGLKFTGEEIGWGFQLQSPTFILIMMMILFILSLNLFGLFEFITPGGSKLGSAQVNNNFSGDFFSGVLTTILSTPCSAPFLGTALTFALTSTNSTIFVMFFFIGLGLAFPFILTALFPQSLVIFPRPGAWMEKLKYFLGFSLLSTVVWLYDVFSNLVDYPSISWQLNLLFALFFFAFFFAAKVSQKRSWQFIFFAIPLVMSVLLIQHLKSPLAVSSEVSSSEWIPWSESKLADEKGKLVFVDFTAAWCLTCKVNKKLVLETDSFESLKHKYNLVTMRADWTKRDDNITQFLKRFKIVGVPAYFVQSSNGEIHSLGETITVAKIEEYLKR